MDDRLELLGVILFWVVAVYSQISEKLTLIPTRWCNELSPVELLYKGGSTRGNSQPCIERLLG